jgi:hypothetical protein
MSSRHQRPPRCARAKRNPPEIGARPCKSGGASRSWRAHMGRSMRQRKLHRRQAELRSLTGQDQRPVSVRMLDPDRLVPRHLRVAAKLVMLREQAHEQAGARNRPQQQPDPRGTPVGKPLASEIGSLDAGCSPDPRRRPPAPRAKPTHFARTGRIRGPPSRPQAGDLAREWQRSRPRHATLRSRVGRSRIAFPLTTQLHGAGLVLCWTSQPRQRGQARALATQAQRASLPPAIRLR